MQLVLPSSPLKTNLKIERKLDPKIPPVTKWYKKIAWIQLMTLIIASYSLLSKLDRRRKIRCHLHQAPASEVVTHHWLAQKRIALKANLASVLREVSARSPSWERPWIRRCTLRRRRLLSQSSRPNSMTRSICRTSHHSSCWIGKFGIIMCFLTNSTLARRRCQWIDIGYRLLVTISLVIRKRRQEVLPLKVMSGT